MEVVKTGDPDKAAVNLEILIKTHLIANPETRKNVQEYLSERKAGEGLTLPDLALSLAPILTRPAERFQIVTIKCNSVPVDVLNKIKAATSEIGSHILDVRIKLPENTAVSSVRIGEDQSVELDIDVPAQSTDKDLHLKARTIASALSESLGQCRVAAPVN